MIQPGEPMLEWSHSRLRCFAECRRRFWYVYLQDEVLEQPVERLVNGSQFHAAIRAYGVACWHAGEPELPKLIPDIAVSIDDPATQDSFDWWARDQRWDWDGWWGGAEFEVPLEVELPDGLGTWRQHMDWLQIQPGYLPAHVGKQVARCRDWKGGWGGGKTPPHPPKQLRRYAWGILAAMPEVVAVSLEIESLGNSWIQPGIDGANVAWEYDRAMAAVVLRGIVRDVEAVNENLALGDDPVHWPTAPGEDCKHCTYGHHCPAFELRREYVYDPETQEPLFVSEFESDRLRDLECYHRAQANAMSRELQKRWEETGPIQATNGDVGDKYQSAEKVDATNMNALVQLLIDGKADLGKILSFKKGQGQRLWDDAKERYQKHLEKKDSGTKWGWKKPKGAESDG